LEIKSGSCYFYRFAILRGVWVIPISLFFLEEERYLDTKEVRQKILDLGAEIQDKLLPVPGHKKRIAYAHIFGVIKNICKVSYDEADQNKVLAIIEAIRLEPNGTSKEIYTIAKDIYKKS